MSPAGSEEPSNISLNCPICEANGNDPTWSIRARRAVQNTETQMITYQDAVFEIKGVPVLYMPYFAHPDPTSKRRSGLLIPDMGNSSKYGLFYEQPYYWSISPSQDMTISPMVSAGVNPLVKVDYRKRFFSGFIDLESSFTNEQEFNSDGDKFGDETWRSHLYGTGRFAINQDWQWGFGVERQTDDLYDHRYDIDGEDDLRGLVASQPRQLLSQLFTTGQQEDFYFEAAAYVFQGLREFVLLRRSRFFASPCYARAQVRQERGERLVFLLHHAQSVDHSLKTQMKWDCSEIHFLAIGLARRGDSHSFRTFHGLPFTVAIEVTDLAVVSPVGIFDRHVAASRHGLHLQSRLLGPVCVQDPQVHGPRPRRFLAKRGFPIDVPIREQTHRIARHQTKGLRPV